MAWRVRDQTGSHEKIRDGGIREAQPAMRVVAAKFLPFMRQEIHDNQPTTRPEHACCFADGGAWALRVMQHHVECHRVEVSRWEGKCGHLRLAYLAMSQSAAEEVGAGDREHVPRKVDPYGILYLCAQQLKDVSSARADIQKIFRGLALE